MKYNKIFRILGLAVILSLLAVALPAAPAHAADPLLYLDPEDDEVGAVVDLIGLRFIGSKDVNIYFSSDPAEVGEYMDVDVTAYEKVRMLVTATGGSFETSFDYFVVPSTLNDGDDVESVSSGTYYIYATYYDEEIIAVAEFEVTGGGTGNGGATGDDAIIELYPEEGPVGEEVEITGEGFGGSEDIIIEFDGDKIKIEDGDRDTDRDGEFTCYIYIPESAAEDHVITVIGDDSDIEAEAEFWVEPEMTINPKSGMAGDKVTVSGTGFGKLSKFIIYFDDEEVETDKTGRDGSFETTFTVPQVAAGTYWVEVEDEDVNTGDAEFTVSIITEAIISKTTGNVGAETTISGTGFKADGTVTIKYDDIAVATVTADSNGDFSVTFKVPPSQHGNHTITAFDGINTKTLTFTMESTPPPAPALLLPEDDSKAEAEAEIDFDWDDVDDPSQPVTYTFQIAADEDFSTIVIEKKELTKSEFTITAAEKEKKLKPTEKEAPYYWRVMATDSATNEGEWSKPSSFYVGSAFALPGWTLYTLIGLGVAFFFLLGFWLGRRTADYTI